MATTEAPKLTFVRTARRADVAHIDDSDGSMGRGLSRWIPRPRRRVNSFFLSDQTRVQFKCREIYAYNSQ